MSIWFNKDLSCESIQKRNAGTMVEYLGINFTEIGDDYMIAVMPANEKTVQPLGIVHGGASCVLAETLGSVAANCVLDNSKQYAVGLEINANHIRSVKKGGIVKGITRPIHTGRSTQVWEIEMFNEEEKLTCISRLTMSVMNR